MSDGRHRAHLPRRPLDSGATPAETHKDYNERGLGVCIVGQFRKSPPNGRPAPQASAARGNGLKARVQDFPTAASWDTKDIRASSTECPGKRSPMAKLAARAGMILSLDYDGIPLESVAHLGAHCDAARFQ